MKNKAVQKAEAELGKRTKETTSLRDRDFVSTGVTLINLATYGRTHGGIAKGTINRICGLSSSGKTFLCRTILAEAARNPEFDSYDLIYDDVERGALMDTEKFFGKKLVSRLVPPARSKIKLPIYSSSSMDFYRRIGERLKKGRKVIWILDSLDSLDRDSDSKMGDGKAKVHSQELRRLLEPLAETGSILVLISQVRMNMKAMSPWDPPHIASGGMAPEFYSAVEIWLRKAKTLKTSYRGKKYTSGIQVRAHIKKNRTSGNDCQILFPFSRSYGIDDIGANIDYLIDNKHWKYEKSKQEEDSQDDEADKSKSIILAEDFDIAGTRAEVIQRIEGKNLQRELQVLTGRIWNDIESAINVERIPRYS